MKEPHENPALVRAKYEQIIDHIREAARRCGYAIGVHGSLARDIDLIAAPWADDAVGSEELAQAVAKAAADAGDEWASCGPISPEERPHGRMCWVIHLQDRTYIDLSIMPRSQL